MLRRLRLSPTELEPYRRLAMTSVTETKKMGIFVRKYAAHICWICGKAGTASREHKIKASDLRRQFGSGAVVVGSFREHPSSYRLAQGLNSGRLKFQAVICQRCNTSVTQESDVVYDRLIGAIEGHHDDPEDLMGPALSSLGWSDVPLPIYRYFAKLLGCHLAEIQAPIPVHLSRFVAKRTAQNCVWLGIRQDVGFRKMTAALPNETARYAAHGGLAVITKLPKFLPHRIYSTLTVGGIQFFFYYVYTAQEVLEMRLRHRQFISRCAETARKEIQDPTDPDVLNILGLERTDEPA